MKKDGKYRFSLQFSDDTMECRKAGELLESLGNRKSVLIVAALNEYLAAHPELEQENCSIQVSMNSVASQDELERMVQRLVEERINGWQSQYGLDFISSNLSGARLDTNVNAVGQGTSFSDRDWTEKSVLKELEADVSQMLDNLDFFNNSE